MSYPLTLTKYYRETFSNLVRLRKDEGYTMVGARRARFLRRSSMMRRSSRPQCRGATTARRPTDRRSRSGSPPDSRGHPNLRRHRHHFCGKFGVDVYTVPLRTEGRVFPFWAPRHRQEHVGALPFGGRLGRQSALGTSTTPRAFAPRSSRSRAPGGSSSTKSNGHRNCSTMCTSSWRRKATSTSP